MLVQWGVCEPSWNSFGTLLWKNKNAILEGTGILTIAFFISLLSIHLPTRDTIYPTELATDTALISCPSQDYRQQDNQNCKIVGVYF
jgi:hypothetical protein